MTNIIPQAPNHNRQLWENLERYCRNLAEQGSELYIVMGSYGTGGTGSSGFMTTIAG
jgi:endonuclease G